MWEKTNFNELIRDLLQTQVTLLKLAKIKKIKINKKFLEDNFKKIKFSYKQKKDCINRKPDGSI